MDIPRYPSLYLRDAETERRGSHFLPHWSQADAAWFVTFRLHDSLPESVLARWREERELLLRTWTGDAAGLEMRLRTQFTERIEQYLDAGHGECLMLDPEIAALVEGALKHFDGNRYVLWAWSVMPNHVHTVVQRLGRWTLQEILHTWKSYTAHAMNRRLGRTGTRWQPEYFDHLPRSASAFTYYVDYTYQNPAAAKLRDWHWCGTRPVVWPEE